MTLILTVFQAVVLSAINRRRDRDNPRPEEYTQEMKDQEKDLGDDATFFRFTI